MESTLSVTEAVKKFVTNIKKKYKERRLIHEEQLLCSKSEKLVRLELVERERLQASKQRGSDDDKVIRTPLAYSDLFKIESGKKKIKTILIDGDAGIGKTTFCMAISEDWADGNILKEFEILLLLPLREQEVASAGSLFDLIKLLHPNQKVCDLVKEYFEEDEGNILVVADGWDELGKEKRDKGSFLYKFLFGSQYCSISTVVTSRPSASTSLHRRKCIDRFAEIRGFDKEHIVEYINSEFASDPKKVSDLLEKLENNPIIESICSIPLNCVIVCHLWHIGGDLPTTMTRLYTQIIFNIVLRNIRKMFPAYENTLHLSSFDDLPEGLQRSWWLLCKFALQTLKKDQLVFSDKELKDFFPQGMSLGDDILCFGLLQSSVSYLEVGCGRSFHFLHLTFQEYLAALFLVKEESDSHAAESSSLDSTLVSLFRGKFCSRGINRDQIVFRFFFGIAFAFVTFQSQVGQRMLTIFESEFTMCQDHSYYSKLALCHWAFEAQNAEFVRIIANQIEGNFASFSEMVSEIPSNFSEVASVLCGVRRYDYLGECPHNPHDFAAVVYVIAHTPECSDMKIMFRRCNLRDNHIVALTDALANKHGKLQVKELNLDDNELTDKCVTDLFHRASAAFRSLEELNLQRNRLRGGGINSALAALAKSFNKCLKVKFLYVDSPLEVPSLIMFRDALYHLQLSNLTELYLQGSLSSDADTNAELILALGHCHSLSVLSLSENNLHVPGGRALGKLLPQLSLSLLIMKEVKLGDEGMAALTQSLGGEFCIEGKLDLENNDIHAAGILCLADNVCAKKIKFLCLDGNPLCLEGAMALIRLLGSEYFQTCSLSLRGCRLTTVGDGNTRTRPRSDSLNTGSSLSCVGIREWICSQEIKINNVKVLILCDSFTGEGIHLLAGFMYLCPQMRDLCCSHCGITSNDLKQLLSLLSLPNLNIEIWDLEYNNLDDDGVSALIEQLPMFPSLTCIYICNNYNISQEMLKTLKEICRRREWFQTQCRKMCYNRALLPLEARIEIAVLREEVASAKFDNQRSTQDLLGLTTTRPIGAAEEMSSFNETVFDRQSKMTAGEEVDQQHLKMDSGRTSITESQLQIRFHQDIQPDKAMVAEEDLSEILDRQKEQSSNSEDYFSPPSSPVAYYENESEHWALQTRATEEMSSFEVTALSGECRTVANEEVDQLHPIVVKPGRTAIHESQIREVLLALKEVTRPHQLGIYLGIEKYELEKIEIDHPRIERQMTEVITYWLRNNSNCSWEALANAVEKMGGHGNLVERLRKKDLETQ